MDISSLINEQLKKVEAIENEFIKLSTPVLTQNLEEENTKLKYQLLTLERALISAKETFNNHSISVLGSLVTIFTQAITKGFPDIKNPLVLVTPTTNDKFGDYQCNSPMNLSKVLANEGVKKTPKEIADIIVLNLTDCGVIAKCEVAPAGFINIFLHRDFIAGEISKIINRGVLPPRIESRRVIVDYSSPNIAKEMHVGHLRSTIIGDCLARLLRFLKFNVSAVNHIGDWGTQFGMLIAHLQDIFPNYKSECPPIRDLATFYKEAKLRFDSDEDFKKRAYESVVRLQSHDTDSLRAWNLICEVSRKEFEKIYQRLGVENLIEKGESFYQKHMEEIVSNLESRGLLEFDEGRKILRSEECETHLLMVKSDGGFTYDTSDLAALKYRLVDERTESIIYVVDNGQAKHFEGLFAAGKKVGIVNQLKHRLEHVGFGVVLGADRKKFKSRANETVRLADLLDEGMTRSLAKLKEKGRDQELTQDELDAAQQAVAYGCIKYADLSHHRIKDYIFSFDKMLEDKGNTAVYLLYAYTRISGISRTAKLSIDDLRNYLQSNKLTFTHEKEWKLAKWITKFPEILLKMQEDLLPHSLCDYLYELCCTFTEFYEACYCVEKDKETGDVKINEWRIVLSEATAQVLKTGFHILGLNPVQRM